MAQDRHSHGIGSGEGKAVDSRVMDQRLTGLTAALDKVQHAVRQSALDERLDDQSTGQPCRVARLEHDRIAGDQRRRHHPDRKCDREVERSDNAKHAVGTKHHAAPLGGRGARPLLAETRRCAPFRRNSGG